MSAISIIFPLSADHYRRELLFQFFHPIYSQLRRILFATQVYGLAMLTTNFNQATPVLERPSRPSCLKKEVPATDSNGDKRRRRLRRNVLFDTISIRQYQVILDNNPLASYEPSLTLDWNHFSEAEIDIDDYESVRDPRRSMQDLKIDHTQRKHILSLSGHRKKDMGEATKIDVSVKNKGYRAHYFSKLKRSFLEHKIARPRIRT